MAWTFWDTAKNEWNAVAPDDPIYSADVGGDSYTGQAGWEWGGKNLEGQQYQYQPDEGGGSVEVKSIVPDWVSQYNREMADFSSGVRNKYGTQFLDLMKEAIERVKGKSPYEDTTKGYVDELGTAYQGYKNSPQYIEEARANIPRQYMAGMQPMQKLQQGALDAMAGRGVLNSSITGNALASVYDQINQGYGQTVRDADTWAAQQNLAYTQNLPQMTQSIINTVNNLDKYWLAKELGWGQLAGQGQGSVNQLIAMGPAAAAQEAAVAQANYQPWQTLLPLLLGG